MRKFMPEQNSLIFFFLLLQRFTIDLLIKQAFGRCIKFKTETNAKK